MMKKFFNNITIDEFYKLDDVRQYEPFMRFIKAKNSFLGKSFDFDDLTFGEVCLLRRLIERSDLKDFIEMYGILYKIDAKTFLNAPILDLFQANRYFVDLMKALNEKESKINKQFQGKDEAQMKWELAGGKRLYVFGELGIMIRLGKEFSCSPEEIAEWKYSTVYNTMLYNSIENEINKMLKDIK